MTESVYLASEFALPATATTTVNSPSVDGDFERAFVALQGPLIGYAWAICGDRSLAEEVVVAAFAKALPRYRSGGVDNLGAYLRRAIANDLRSWRRRAAIRTRLAHLVASPSHVADDKNDPGPPWSFVARLPPRQRAVVVLRFGECLSVEETAQILGIRPGTVKSQTAKALQSLRAHMETES